MCSRSLRALLCKLSKLSSHKSLQMIIRVGPQMSTQIRIVHKLKAFFLFGTTERIRIDTIAIVQLLANNLCIFLIPDTYFRVLRPF